MEVNWNIHPELYRRIYALWYYSAREGIGIRFTSAFRTWAQQAQLYQNYLDGRSALPAAPPGRSKHEHGRAVDLVSNNLPRVVAIARQLGLRWAGRRDPVHFEI